MSTAPFIMWLTVLLVGIPSAWRNPTAAALVVSWLAGELFSVITGDSLPVQFYVLPDIFVIAVIMAKHDYRSQQPYRSAWHQFICLAMERTPADRVILAIFPVMWLLYIADLHAFYKWWALYYLVLAQFAASGLEAFRMRRASKAVSDTPESTSGDLYRFAWGRGYG